MFDLPPHLQTLNALPSSSSPPSSAFNAEQEEAFWSLLNTDELFNFGVAPSAFESKSLEESKRAAAAAAAASVAAAAAYPPPNTPAAPTPTLSSGASPAAEKKGHPTLEAFLATFANDPTPSALPGNYLLPLPVPFTPASTSSAPTPTASGAVVKTADIMPRPSVSDSLFSGEDRITGAKRLKSIGAPPAEIEEDKRRRNTEASARFRAKKKEREQALEQRAHELEAQVAALTAEKASLEKENNLLKFIVVNGNGGTAGTDSLQNALASLGKRKRDE